MTSPHQHPYDGFPPPAHRGHQPQTGPTDPPPWAAAPPPIPSYVPPPPGQQHGPQDLLQTPPPAPAPTPPRRSQLRYADWGERVGATLVDWTIIFVPVMALSAISDSLGGLAALVWLGLGGYVAWLNGSKGQSPGKAIMGLRLVRDADGSTLGGPVGLVRALVLGLSFWATVGILFAVVTLWPLKDAKKQALHDKVVSASVVAGYPRARLGKDLFRP